MPKKLSKTRKPLTISIHGEDLDIEAKIRDTKDLSAVLTAIAKQTQTPMITGSASNDGTPLTHDFDAVQRVIKNGDVTVLESFITLAQAEIDQRKSAS